MKTFIENMNQSIAAKCNELKNEVNKGLSAIILPNVFTPVPHTSSSQTGTPPITYILYGLAGLSAIGALSISGFRIVGLGIAAICAYGGYRSSSTNSKQKVVTGTPIIDIERLKSDVSSKVILLIRKVTDEWDDYMQHNKNNLQDAINQSTLDENLKDDMANRIFIHEVFDISMADFNARMNTARTVAEIKSVIETFRSKMLNAIESTGRKQIEKYQSLL